MNITVCEYVEKHHYVQHVDDDVTEVDIVNSFIMLFGLFITFYGNKYVEKILLILGFFPGFYAIYYLLNITLNQLSVGCTSIIVLSFMGGTITSSISYRSITTAYTLFGFLVGSSLGYFLYLIIMQYINIGTIYIYSNSFIITELVTGITGSIIFYKKKDKFLMIFTALVGPFFALKYLDKIIFGNRNQGIFSLDIKDINSNPFSIVTYIILYLLLSFMGVMIQNKRYVKEQQEDNRQQYIYQTASVTGLNFN